MRDWWWLRRVGKQRVGCCERLPFLMAKLGFATPRRPSLGCESFELKLGQGVETAAEDEQVAASAGPGQKPQRGDVAGFEHEQDFGFAEGPFGVLNFELQDGRPHPVQGGFVAHQGKAALGPAHGIIAAANIAVRAESKSADDENDHEDEESEAR